MKNEIIIEYDNRSLKDLSYKLYNLFNNNGYSVILLGNDLTINEKINIIKNDYNKKFIISNKLNTNNNLEIIYPLRDNDNLARALNNNLGSVVNKYYQLRSSYNTNEDYYEILRNINNNQGIIIKYGNSYLNNDTIINTIFNTINKYLKEENIYIVKSGDTLYSIARKYNIPVTDLINANNLTNNNLSLGQKLIIPEKDVNEIPNNQTTYIVKNGDSLYAIAKKYNTTVDEIKKLNNLTNNNLSINQKLLIPTDNKTSNDNITYTVKSGDSLYAIARKYNTTVDEIKRLNNLTNNNLSINQKLLIPTDNETSNDNITYTVKSGDSLYAIARKYNTTVDEIKRLNNLTNNNLSINQKLLIPTS